MNTEPNNQYTVVARRYRPQVFSDLVGQTHISTALSNAIKQNRVGHAYLFTGARGVGKTSSARIFAKCLNCEKGPTVKPCNKCDICEAVSLGEDVDVLEIDGASNRGIDEIRQLRSNAGVRPSRSRFKIYIIDEVHMLTPQAFNALLKTLEEPPGHVKFIFCTTDPQKIPITVLSRCQRFDFSPVQTDEISQRLREIAENEGVHADDAALALLARRANGSMRDSQSLLEQLFSFCGKEISVEEVNQLLGTADISRIVELAEAMTECDAATSLGLVNHAATDGVDAGQLAQQLLGFYRDMMAVRVGCDEETLLSCTAADMDMLKKLSDKLGLETILTIVQIIDGAVVRMQFSVHARTLLEMAIVRICNLEKMESIAELVSVLSSGAKLAASPGAASAKSGSKKNEAVESKATQDSKSYRVSSNTASAQVPEPNPAKPVDAAVSDPGESSPIHIPVDGPNSPEPPPGIPLDQAEVKTIWEKALTELGDMTADMARDYEKLELCDSNKLVVTLQDSYNRDMCNRPDRKTMLESALTRIAGQQLRVDFLVSTSTTKQQVPPQPKMSRRQQMRQLHDQPLVKKAMEVFDAEIIDFRNPK